MQIVQASWILVSCQLLLIMFLMVCTDWRSYIKVPRALQTTNGAFPNRTGVAARYTTLDHDTGGAANKMSGYFAEADGRALDPRWPRRLLYVWCRAGDFTFLHYMSVLSAIRAIQPSAVMFAARYLPHTHVQSYNTWLEDLRSQFPFWLTVNLTVTDYAALCLNTPQRLLHVHSFLNRSRFLGSMVLFDQTLIVNSFVLEDPETTLSYYDAERMQGFVYFPEQSIYSNTTVITQNASCPIVELTEQLPTTCYILGSGHQALYPESIMFDPSPVAAELRWIFYGSREYPYQRPDSNTPPAPNIAHYVWLGGGRMKYTFYMSVLSALYVGKVEKVCVHGNLPPAGDLWTQLVDHHRVQFIPWHRTSSIYDQHIDLIQHQADVLKSSVMWSQGGILMDPDMIFVRQPEAHMFQYEALVMAGGHRHMLNPSVSISKPHSRYARLWIEGERHFVNGVLHKKYVWNCCYKMYKVWERRPNIAHVVRNFSLICIRGHCYPMWVKEDAMSRRYANVDLMVNLTDWKNEVVTVHFVSPDPYVSFEACVNELQGIAGEVGRSVLRAAGLLGQQEGLVP